MILKNKFFPPQNFSVKKGVKKSVKKGVDEVSTLYETSVMGEDTKKGSESNLGVIGSYYNNAGEDIRGLFFIVKGHYKKGVGDSFINEVSGNISHIGGYDPKNENIGEWYTCLDKVTY